MSMQEIVSIDVEDFEAETEKAYKIQDIKRHHAWVPKSQISYRRKNKDNSGVIEVPMWLAEKLGVDYEEK